MTLPWCGAAPDGLAMCSHQSESGRKHEHGRGHCRTGYVLKGQLTYGWSFDTVSVALHASNQGRPNPNTQAQGIQEQSGVTTRGSQDIVERRQCMGLLPRCAMGTSRCLQGAASVLVDTVTNNTLLAPPVPFARSAIFNHDIPAGAVGYQ